jgi:hypothetical protein
LNSYCRIVITLCGFLVAVKILESVIRRISIMRRSWMRDCLQYIRGRKDSHVRFEVFTAVTVKNGAFWDVTPCGSCKNRRSYKSHTA